MRAPIRWWHATIWLRFRRRPSTRALRADHDRIIRRSTTADRQGAAGRLRHLGAEIGATMVLHTWGQTLTHHPHVHCIVPGCGLAPDGKTWIA